MCYGCAWCGKLKQLEERFRPWYVHRAPTNPFLAAGGLAPVKVLRIRTQLHPLGHKLALCNACGTKVAKNNRTPNSLTIVGEPDNQWKFYSPGAACAELGFRGGACWVPVVRTGSVFAVRYEYFEQLAHQHGLGRHLRAAGATDGAGRGAIAGVPGSSASGARAAARFGVSRRASPLVGGRQPRSAAARGGASVAPAGGARATPHASTPLGIWMHQQRDYGAAPPLFSPRNLTGTAIQGGGVGAAEARGARAALTFDASDLALKVNTLALPTTLLGETLSLDASTFTDVLSDLENEPHTPKRAGVQAQSAAPSPVPLGMMSVNAHPPCEDMVEELFGNCAAEADAEPELGTVEEYDDVLLGAGRGAASAVLAALVGHVVTPDAMAINDTVFGPEFDEEVKDAVAELHVEDAAAAFDSLLLDCAVDSSKSGVFTEVSDRQHTLDVMKCELRVAQARFLALKREAHPEEMSAVTEDLEGVFLENATRNALKVFSERADYRDFVEAVRLQDNARIDAATISEAGKALAKVVMWTRCIEANEPFQILQQL